MRTLIDLKTRKRIHVDAMWVVWCDLHDLSFGHKVDTEEDEVREVVVVEDG